jgi:hypothetical protein
VLFNESGPQVITYPILSKDEWSTYNTPTLRGAQFAMRYIGFTDDTNGFVYAPSEPLGTFFTLDRFSGIQNIQTDVLSGDVVIVKDNRVYKWEPADGMPLYYTWKSKVFDVPKPLNFSCVIVKSTPAQIVVSQATIDTAIEFNLERMAFKLNPLGRVVLGGSRTEVLAGDPFDPVEPGDLIGIRQDRFPVGGSPLFNIVRLSGLEESAVLNVYADGTLRASLNVTPNLVQRLPSGFKAHTWQLELLGNLRVYSMAMATTARELSQV